MRASEIITNLNNQIELEKKVIAAHTTKLNTLMDILHMAKKDGYIEKKDKIEKEGSKHEFTKPITCK